MFDRVSGIQICSSQPDALRRWYRDTLDLPVDEESGAFLLNGTYLGIDSHSRVNGPALEPYRIMLNLDTRDIHRDVAALAAKGVNFIRPPEAEEWGGMFATFADPDGNYIQLMQLPGA